MKYETYQQELMSRWRGTDLPIPVETSKEKAVPPEIEQLIDSKIADAEKRIVEEVLKQISEVMLKSFTTCYTMPLKVL